MVLKRAEYPRLLARKPGQNTKHTAITKIKKQNAIYELWLVPPELDMSGKHMLLKAYCISHLVISN
jgi:hypothetical protein